MSKDLWPQWLQERSEYIRDDSLADYVSFDALKDEGEEREQVASLLLLTQSSLEGYRLTYRRVGSAESHCRFRLSMVPLSGINAIEMNSSVDKWIDGGAERERSGTIRLNRELGDWGKDIDLPLSDEDYRGSKDAAAAAAGRFLDALKHLISPTRPSN